MDPNLPPVVQVNPVAVPASPAGGPVQTPAPVVPPPAKKGFPVTIIIILIVLILGGGLAYFFGKELLGKVTGNQTVELTYWGLWEDDSTINSLISDYEAKNPNVKIKYVRQSQQDYRERLTNAFAKGQAPDIFRFHNSWVPMFKDYLDSMPATVMNAAEFSQTYYPVASSDLTSGTGIVGIPMEYDGLTLFINEDLFAKAGATPPMTWDELRTLAKELTIKDDQGTITQAGVALGRTENVDNWQDILALMMIQNGVDLNNPTGQLAEDALTYFTVFSTVDGVWDATLPPSTTAFASGKLAMYFAPSWRVFEIKQQNPDLKFRAVPLPQLPKSNPNDPDVSYASYWAEGVWSGSSSKNKAAAWDFLKFLSTDDSLQKLYKNASAVRLFGEPYPKVSMASTISTDTYIGPLISQAPYAKSWYLDSMTWDGPTGINSLMSKYFEDAINAVNSGTTANAALTTAAAGVTQVLQQYNLIGK
jgi:multiple sugar transport system substrate-binding protein